MATIKSYTDINQSRKLAEILPIESADAHYMYRHWEIDENTIGSQSDVSMGFNSDFYYGADNSKTYHYIPCWSLAALLCVLPKKYYPIKDHETNLILGKPKDKWCVLYWDATGMQDGEQTSADNPVDACYEMIIKLHEQKLL